MLTFELSIFIKFSSSFLWRFPFLSTKLHSAETVGKTHSTAELPRFVFLASLMKSFKKVSWNEIWNCNTFSQVLPLLFFHLKSNSAKKTRNKTVCQRSIRNPKCQQNCTFLDNLRNFTFSSGSNFFHFLRKLSYRSSLTVPENIEKILHIDECRFHYSSKMKSRI